MNNKLAKKEKNFLKNIFLELVNLKLIGQFNELNTSAERFWYNSPTIPEEDLV